MVAWKFGLHVLGMAQGPILQLTLVPDVGVAGWKRTNQFLWNNWEKSKPKITGWSKFLQTMNCWGNLLGIWGYIWLFQLDQEHPHQYSLLYRYSFVLMLVEAGACQSMIWTYMIYALRLRLMWMVIFTIILVWSATFVTLFEVSCHFPSCFQKFQNMVWLGCGYRYVKCWVIVMIRLNNMRTSVILVSWLLLFPIWAPGWCMLFQSSVCTFCILNFCSPLSNEGHCNHGRVWEHYLYNDMVYCLKCN